MTYKLNPAIGKIISPVTLIKPDGEKMDFLSGIEATAATFDKPVRIQNLLAVESTIEIYLSEAEPLNTPPALNGDESFF